MSNITGLKEDTAAYFYRCFWDVTECVFASPRIYSDSAHELHASALNNNTYEHYEMLWNIMEFGHG